MLFRISHHSDFVHFCLQVAEIGSEEEESEDEEVCKLKSYVQ
jgi:hypothetical protein